MFDYLPTNLAEIKQKGWDSVDIILISGDAYVDHPSFAAAIIGRYLESKGYKVAIIPQPNWNNEADFTVCGKPNLFFGITSGNLDSMIANYTSEKNARREDEYSENCQPGKRPDRAVIVYSNLVRRLFPESPIVIGGIEASLRRFTHYDFWSNNLRRSILFDTRADILVYGMGEESIVEIASRIRNKQSLVEIPNTAYISSELPSNSEICLFLPSHEEQVKNKTLFLSTALLYEKEMAKKYPRRIIHPCQNKFVILESPKSISLEEFDKLYFLPFMRTAHPRYHGPIPAYSFVKDSVVTHRGCYGGCSFCSLTVHQGKNIISRSEDSILSEIKDVVSKDKTFKGVIQDVGGPSANMYGSVCSLPDGCNRLSCIFPDICKNLVHNQKKHLKLLSTIMNIAGVNKVFVNSGVRYDLALLSPEYMEGLIGKHISGQLSMAPEHYCKNVLDLMQKPEFSVYERFVGEFQRINKKVGKQQYIIPYFISSHPGCKLDDMFALAMYMRKNKMRIKQVQNYIPIPLTLSAAMYYCESDVFTKKPIYVAKGDDRKIQRALLQPWLDINKKLVQKALIKLNQLKQFSFLTN